MKIWQILELPAAMTVGAIMCAASIALATHPSEFALDNAYNKGFSKGHSAGIAACTKAERKAYLEKERF